VRIPLANGRLKGGGEPVRFDRPQAGSLKLIDKTGEKTAVKTDNFVVDYSGKIIYRKGMAIKTEMS
jgi:hypothetical protein